MEGDDPMMKKYVPFSDGVHTTPSGGLLMAHTILTGLHAPALVSEAIIDVSSSKAVGNKCKIADLAIGAEQNDITFMRSDEALPLPVQKDWLPMLPFTNELKDLNWYGLIVKGLKDGDYNVSIDGVAAGKFPAKDLTTGVNLGNLTSGPLFDQANKVLNAINAKNHLVAQRFFDVVLFKSPNWLKDVADERKPVELKKRMEKIDEAQTAIYKLAEPKTHKFEIKRVP